MWSYHHNASTWELRTVLQPLVHEYAGDIITLVVAGETIQATATHPFWVIGNENLNLRPSATEIPLEEQAYFAGGRWIAAQHLQIDDRLFLKDGSISVVQRYDRQSQASIVYNLMVEGLHNYAVSCLGVLVHNKAAKVIRLGGDYTFDHVRYHREIKKDALQKISQVLREQGQRGFQGKVGTNPNITVNKDGKIWLEGQGEKFAKKTYKTDINASDILDQYRQ